MNKNILSLTWKATRGCIGKMSVDLISLGSIVFAVGFFVLIPTVLFHAVISMTSEDKSFADGILQSAVVMGSIFVIVIAFSCIMLGWIGCLLLGNYDRKDIHISYLGKTAQVGNAEARKVSAEDVRKAAQNLTGNGYPQIIQIETNEGYYYTSPTEIAVIPQMLAYVWQDGHVRLVATDIGIDRPSDDAKVLLDAELHVIKDIDDIERLVSSLAVQGKVTREEAARAIRDSLDRMPMVDLDEEASCHLLQLAIGDEENNGRGTA